MLGRATVAEVRLVTGRASARIACEPAQVPAPGRYLLAHDPTSSAPLATELFAAAFDPDGFTAAPPVPRKWRPGCTLNVRGPLGMGFEIPAQARRVALLAFGGNASRLMPLVDGANRRGLAVALISDDPPADLPLPVEVQPLAALKDVCAWADYLAADIERDSLATLLGSLLQQGKLIVRGQAQVLVGTRMPCGGVAACGVCTVRTRDGAALACVEGPVFELADLSLEA